MLVSEEVDVQDRELCVSQEKNPGEGCAGEGEGHPILLQQLICWLLGQMRQGPNNGSDKWKGKTL
jgi:hypothetical protein